MKAIVPACAALLALLALSARADHIVFKDDLELGGPKVEILREHDRGVDVKVSHGTVTIAWPRVKEITIDYENHLSNMKSDNRDTPRGLLGFAQVLLRHDMPKEAAAVCTLILGKDKVTEDILLDVADLMEKQKDWALAKSALELVIRINPARQDVVARFDHATKQLKESAVEPVKEPGKEPTKEPVKEPTKEPAKEPAKTPTPEPGPKAIEGLEAEEDWVSEPWGNKADIAVIEQPQVKNKVLSVTYAAADKDKVAVRLGGSWDLTEREFLTLDVWNAGDKSIGFSVAFNTMPGWKFLESAATSISPKQWTTVKISLTEKRFKSEDSNWRNTSELVNRDNVKQAILLIYNTSKDGVVYFDNIRFVAKGGDGGK